MNTWWARVTSRMVLGALLMIAGVGTGVLTPTEASAQTKRLETRARGWRADDAAYVAEGRRLFRTVGDDGDRLYAGHADGRLMGPGRIDMFTNSDGALLHKWYANGSWTRNWRISAAS